MATARSGMTRAEEFDELRPLLFGTAYRMLSSVMDAEDVLQDAYLRWQNAAHTEIASPRAHLTTMVTRLCLDHLRSARVQRERYVGPWLPAPLLTSPDPADRVELAEPVSIALLVVLGTLSPLERAVFVLREAFAFSNAEIAAMPGKCEPAVRQLARRARAADAASAAGKLARLLGRAVEHGADLLEGNGEHVVEHVGEPLGRRQHLEHNEQREANGVGEQRLVLGVDAVRAVDDRVRQARVEWLLPSHLA